VYGSEKRSPSLVKSTVMAAHGSTAKAAQDRPDSIVEGRIVVAVMCSRQMGYTRHVPSAGG
jgi:hypothetical protein